MARIIIESGDSPEIHITRVAGSLQVKAWDEDGIRIDVEHEDTLNYSFDDDDLELTVQSDCVLRIPGESSLHIESVGADVYVANIEGELEIKKISGSLTLKNVGATTIDEVSGNLSARAVEGDLSVGKVWGNTTLREIEGDVEATEVLANLSLRDIEGDISASSRGNAELRLEPEDGTNVEVSAKGNLFCYVDDDADADVTLHSDSEQIEIYTETGKQLLRSKDHEFTLGDGGTDMRLSAAGHIDFRAKGKASSFNFDMDLDFVDDVAGLADGISEQVTSQVEAQLESLNTQLEALSERLRNSGDRTARNAQRQVMAAQRRLQHKLDLQRTRVRGGKVVTVSGATKKADPVSAAERALILQMVQEKKVSVDEAEMLLNALEGRESSRPAAPEAPAAPAAAEAPEAPEKP